MNRYKYLFCLVTGAFICITHAFAQQNLPYSRYGIGRLLDPTTASLKGWGGLSAASQNPFSVNLGNPASYSAIKLTTFEAGVYGSLSTIGTRDSSQTFGDASIANFGLGFPVVKNKLGACLGIAPFSVVSYNIVQKNDSVPNLGQTANSFQGSGGLYRFFIGSGIKFKNFSAGINIGWLFGTQDYTDILVFEDTVNALDTKKVEERVLRGFLIDAGLQYKIKIGKEYSLDLGVDGNVQTQVAAKRNLLYERLYYASGVEQVVDTVYNSQDSSGHAVLPASVSGGFIFSKENHFSVGVNFKYTAWGQYEFFGQKDLTTNNWTLGIGGEWIPNFKAYDNYLKVIHYRAGFRYGKDYINFEGKNMPQFGATAGLGLPLKRQISQVSFSGEWIHTGTPADNPVVINTFLFTLGLTLNDIWFLKQKFD